MVTIEQVRQRAESDARTYGYFLHPNPSFLRDLLEGLKRNEERYGYLSCPCRLASGEFELDRDILCPCDYRDPDVADFGYCYCSLYLRKDVYEGKTPIVPIPERRPFEKQARAYGISSEASNEKGTETSAIVAKGSSEIRLKLWYCKQCGYVVFREDPPYLCPICKAKREMFTEIKIRAEAFG